MLSVAVVLRGNLGETLARRNARVLGTLLGCLIVVALARLPSPLSMNTIFLLAVGTAHAFVTRRYWLTATAASIMALLQSHQVNPEAGFAIAERVADTFLGALLAWSFSYVLPSWERRGVSEQIVRVRRDLSAYASHSLRTAGDDPVEERLARRQAYDSLAALAASLQRSRVEPAGRAPAGAPDRRADRPRRAADGAPVDGPPDAGPARRRRAGAVAADRRRARRARRRALAAQLDPTAASAPPVAGGDDASLALLPERPAAHDVMPWLSRRLGLMVVEAGRIRAAARDLGAG